MTYLEKFIEVFGYEPSRDLCNTMDCITVGCSECKYDGKGWGAEYNGVAPVIHAKWLKEVVVYSHPWECSNCGAHHRALYDYCPSCGAKMDKEEG